MTKEQGSASIEGMATHESIARYPVWLTEGEADFLIGLLADGDVVRSDNEEAFMKPIVSKIRGAAGAKGQSNDIYQKANDALRRG